MPSFSFLVNPASGGGAAPEAVVSVGGDGMLSSLAGEVSRLGGTLGIVPAGRGNDFARMLGLPDDPLAQADVLLSGRRRTIDLLSYGRRRWSIGRGSCRSSPSTRSRLCGRWRRTPQLAIT